MSFPETLGVIADTVDSQAAWFAALELLPVQFQRCSPGVPPHVRRDCWLVVLDHTRSLRTWLAQSPAPTLLLCASLNHGLRTALRRPHPIIVTSPALAATGLADLLTILAVLPSGTPPLVLTQEPLTKYAVRTSRAALRRMQAANRRGHAGTELGTLCSCIDDGTRAARHAQAFADITALFEQ